MHRKTQMESSGLQRSVQYSLKTTGHKNKVSVNPKELLQIPIKYNHLLVKLKSKVFVAEVQCQFWMFPFEFRWRRDLLWGIHTKAFCIKRRHCLVLQTLPHLDENGSGGVVSVVFLHIKLHLYHQAIIYSSFYNRKHTTQKTYL